MPVTLYQLNTPGLGSHPWLKTLREHHPQHADKECQMLNGYYRRSKNSQQLPAAGMTGSNSVSVTAALMPKLGGALTQAASPIP